MDLFFRKTGSGEPLIILHGLYGSSDNWHSIGRALAVDHEVFMIDLRNHGHSPHHPLHNYEVMCDDLNDFFSKRRIDRAIFLGHSMGGKVALAFGLKNPGMIEKMIVVDISPFNYDLSASQEPNSHQRIIQGLQSIHPETITDRKEADERLQKSVPALYIRQFLLKNLKREPGGRFYWSINLPVLAKNLSGIFAGIISENGTAIDIQQFPLLFIRGDHSGYINKEHEDAIRFYLPWSQILTIHGAGHWVQAEQPVTFLETVRSFISK